MENTIQLPNGCTLYWKQNEAGGRTYYSDEVGEMLVWDTALVSRSTILAALTQEETLNYKEQEYSRKLRE